MSSSAHSDAREENPESSSESHLSPPPLLEKEPSLGVSPDRGERTQTTDPPPATRSQHTSIASDTQSSRLDLAASRIEESPGYRKFLEDHKTQLYNEYQQRKTTQEDSGNHELVGTFDDVFGASQSNSAQQDDDISENSNDEVRETETQQEEDWENLLQNDGEEVKPDQTEQAEDEEISGDEGSAKFVKTLRHPRGRKPGELKRRPDGEYLVEEGGKYQWRQNEEEPWQYAVLHRDIRIDLVREAQAKGRWTHEHARGVMLKSDRTAYYAPHQTWGPQRENRPDILFQYLPTGHKGPRREPSVLYWRGYVVLSEDMWPLLEWAIPTTFSSQERGWYLEALHRTNTLLKPYDILQRMPSHSWKGSSLSNTLAMRRARFRLETGMRAWSNRCKPTQAMLKMDEIVGPRCLRENSTRSLGRDLYPEEIADIRAIGQGKHPERIRNNKTYKDDLVEAKREERRQAKLLEEDKESQISSDDAMEIDSEMPPPPTAPSRREAGSRQHTGFRQPAWEDTIDPSFLSKTRGQTQAPPQSLSNRNDPFDPSNNPFAPKIEEDGDYQESPFLPRKRRSDNIPDQDRRREGRINKLRAAPAPKSRRPRHSLTNQTANTSFNSSSFNDDSGPFSPSPNPFGSQRQTHGISNSRQYTPDTSFNSSSLLSNNSNRPVFPHQNPSALHPSNTAAPQPRSSLTQWANPPTTPFDPHIRRPPPYPRQDHTLISPRNEREKQIVNIWIGYVIRDFRSITGYQPQQTDESKSCREQFEDLEGQLEEMKMMGRVRTAMMGRANKLTRAEGWFEGFRDKAVRR